MSKCPNCGSQLNGDFGMVVCATCQAAVFIDFDGNAQVSKPEDQVVAQEDNQYAQPPTIQPSSDAPATAYQTPPASDLMQTPSYDNSTIEYDQNEDQLNAEVQPTEHPVEVAPQQAAHSTQASHQNFNFSEVVDFGNQISADTPISFDIKIEGIDWADLKKEVLEYLSDSKLALDLKTLSQSIVGGVLIIKQINSVKATVIIRRLEHLQVKISWRQYVATQNRS